MPSPQDHSESAPARVDHELHFPSTEAAEVFIDTAKMRGFKVAAMGPHPERTDLVRVKLFRSAPGDLEHAPSVSKELHELAAPYDGDHVAWTEG